uniref:DNA-directed DNA polymerase n=1 Tax=Angiostrongylus cantonensis TaxID=6313 RepID=A0A0K0DJE1_ANGCA
MLRYEKIACTTANLLNRMKGKGLVFKTMGFPLPLTEQKLNEKRTKFPEAIQPLVFPLADNLSASDAFGL